MRPLFGERQQSKAFESPASPERKARLDLTVPGIRGRPYRVAWDVERAVRDGMKRITWVFRCIHIRATKSAGLPMVVRRGDPEEGEAIPNHELLPLLNAYSSPDEAAWTFRYRLSCIVDLNPQGAFIEVLRDRLDRIVALRLLPVGFTTPIPGSRRDPITGSVAYLDGYRVHVPGTNPLDLRPEQVVWVKHPHPLDPYDGLNPMQASGIAIDTEWMAKLYQRNFLRNDGRMGGLLLVAGELGPDDLDELQSRVDAASGPSGAGRVVVLEATQQDAEGNATGSVGGVDFVDTAVTPREAAYLEMRKYAKEEIHGAWGVPTSIGAADSSNRTYENADADYFMFWSDTMVDHCRMLDRPFDQVDEDPATFVGHNFDSVAVLQREKIARQKQRLEEVTARVITPNEYREVVEREPFAEGGDVVLAPLALIPVATTVAGALEEEEPEPAPQPAQLAPVPDPAAAEAASRKGLEVEMVRFGRFDVPAKALRDRRKERARMFSQAEKQARRVMRSFFKRQERAVLAKLRGTKARQGTRHWEPGNGQVMTVTKQLQAADIFDRVKWDEQLREEGEALVASIAEAFGEDAFDHISEQAKGIPAGAERKEGEAFDPNQPRLLDFIRARGNKIVGANDVTYDRIATVLAEGEGAGATIAELAGLVSEVFAEAERSRSETIARTEVISAANAGSLEGAKQTGIVERKVWLATQDDRTRESHADADGMSVGMDEVFMLSSGAELEYPGDPNAEPEETINCRCTLIYETEGESLV